MFHLSKRGMPPHPEIKIHYCATIYGPSGNVKKESTWYTNTDSLRRWIKNNGKRGDEVTIEHEVFDQWAHTLTIDETERFLKGDYNDD